jgi:anionic cell wall polymer biosynthesis LytR-Cps2A-Psr (LCP) family protein
VTAIGGITFVAGKSLRSVDGYRIMHAGKNRLTSKTALALARERKHLPNGDFGRSANQGRLIKAGAAMLRAAGPRAIPRYLTAMSPHLSTNLSVIDVLNLSAAVFLGNPSKARNTVVPGSIGFRSQQSVVLLGGAARGTFADLRDARIGG